MEKIKEIQEMIRQYSGEEEREVILRGLEELFRFGDMKAMFPELHYACILIREIYPRKEE